jgi:hypothetical protein
MARPSLPIKLRAFFASIGQDEPDDLQLEGLRQHVFAVVDDLKASGLPPERILSVVKTSAIEAGLAFNQEVLVHLAPWFVDRYYDENDATA